VNEICENYDIENEVKAKSDKKIKFSSIKLAKYSYVTYSLITLLFLLYPFATVFVSVYIYKFYLFIKKI